MTIKPKIIQLEHHNGPWVWALIGPHNEVLVVSPCRYNQAGRAAYGLRMFIESVAKIVDTSPQIHAQVQMVFDDWATKLPSLTDLLAGRDQPARPAAGADLAAGKDVSVKTLVAVEG